ncbi:MAG: benzoate/H(+) symporter BenE family transporter [Bauldia sp.]|uniref:benzoate/H(+) symporter BenE family transporter n=1 Tax=Bauldia sp. TaxID=2575872 RepID=UPI001E1159CC|nr:benzoate/H(+) symporter BenE family transporter [Bauldia sp.]MCB1497238.1 benzoate/H(+) symporter BenE family transporter [Bauldia sp.]
MIQLVSAGILTAVVAFATAFAIVLAGLDAAGASQAEAASGLFVLSAFTGLMSIAFSIRLRMPVMLAWSTPAAVLLIATGAHDGGFPVAVGAFIGAGVLTLIAGIWRPFGRAVAAIPMPLANAMLAGILLDICLAPVRAVAELPTLALPIVLAWAVTLRFARFYAVPVAVLVTAVMVGISTPLPSATSIGLPSLVPVMPVFSFDVMVGLALPLFIVSMASQAIPGLAVLRANGYRPAVGPIFTASGLVGVATAFFGAHSYALAAITAALAAGPEAHPDPARRWVATVVAGVAYVILGLGAAYAAAFVAQTPPLLIQAVAGLALLGSIGSSLASAVAEEEVRLPAVITFITTASGLSFFGVSAAFWGLVAGGALMAIMRFRAKPASERHLPQSEDI